MAAFIVVTRQHDGFEILVNIESIHTVSPNGPTSGTLIYFQAEDKVTVKEPYTVVSKMISNAGAALINVHGEVSHRAAD